MSSSIWAKRSAFRNSVDERSTTWFHIQTDAAARRAYSTSGFVSCLKSPQKERVLVRPRTIQKEPRTARSVRADQWYMPPKATRRSALTGPAKAHLNAKYPAANSNGTPIKEDLRMWGYPFMDARKSSLLRLPSTRSLTNSMASTLFMSAKCLRKIQMRCRSALSMSRSSRRVPEAKMSMAG